MRLRTIAIALCTGLLVAAGFTPEIDTALRDATYVYIQSERKSGEWGKTAEIWFHVEDGAVFVGTRPTSWRVKRIQAGRTKARIAVGKADGPAFEATGTLVRDDAVAGRMMDAFAKKYPDGWKKYEQGFRDGFKNGERVLVRYAPR